MQVHTLTPPAVDKLSFRHLTAIARRLRASGLHVVDGAASRVQEPERAVIEYLHIEAPFMHRAVMEAA